MPANDVDQIRKLRENGGKLVMRAKKQLSEENIIMSYILTFS